MPPALIGPRRALLGGGVFTPKQIPDLGLWLAAHRGSFSDAGTTAAVDNDPVQQWNDASVRANTIAQATLGNRPVFKANIINGWPALLFTSASSQVLSAAALNGFSTDPYTGFVVLRRLTTGFNHTIASIGADTGGRQISVSNGDKFKNGRGGQANYAIGATSLGAATWYVATATDDDSNANVYLNGVLDAGPTASAGNYTGGALAVGGRGGAEFYGGYIAEIIAYERLLGTNEQKLVERYLGKKYGIAVA